MKIAKLLHNPGAGNAGDSIDDVSDLIQNAGFTCSTTSVKKMHKKTLNDESYDLVVLAGGDGTVRKAAKQLLDERLPIGLLPMGTANNIARTLGIEGEKQEIINTWKKKRIKRFDVGKIHGLHAKRSDFFLESLGYGVFPKLMKEMKKQDKESINNPERKLKSALELLCDIVMTYKARHCKMKIDGVDHSGEFILAEVMNTRSIGPNLLLAPFADPGDGIFDIVLIGDKQREKFADYIMDKVNDEEKPAFFKIHRARKVEMLWEGKSLHVDDQRMEIEEPQKITIRPVKHALEFLV
jgi:diacylglycerol kinase (ATP)